MKIQRSQFSEHSRECEYRKVKCDRCGQDVVFALMKVRIKYLIENCDLIFNHKHVIILVPRASRLPALPWLERA